MEVLSSYLAIDRLLALTGREPLPERAAGISLFADISGFTALAELLVLTLGRRRGAEELSSHLNSVYEALIREVARYRGSVVAFAGDGITCWFDGDDGRRATTSALEMQHSMRQFADIQLPNGQLQTLAVKVGIAKGTVRRLLVGNPEAQLLDVMAGLTVRESAEATSVTSKHEVALCAQTAAALANNVEVREWRKGANSGAPYAVVGALKSPAEPAGWPEPPVLPETVLRAYLPRPVYERLRAGQGEFLTELRPAVALFLQFDGLDLDNDPEAGARLSAYVQWVQQVLERYGGFLIDVGMSDKGSHFYCCFGAPVAHENSTWRAITAAQELLCPPSPLSFISSTRIGISSGTLRTGAYGSIGRRTYGALGDPVNLAARLMVHAAAGEVLVTEPVRRAVRDAFEWRPRTPIHAKGKAAPVPVFALGGAAGGTGTRPMEPRYVLPLVGRARELETVQAKLDAIVAGHGQVVSLSAEAGLGKSRLVSEVLRLARNRQVAAYVGQCQAHGTNTSYLAWRNIWRALFGLGVAESTASQVTLLEQQLTQIDPALVPRLPLLGAVLNLPIEENEVTRPLEARLRKASLEGLLLDCLRARVKNQPLLLVIEDCHWIDSLSQDLLEAVCRMIGPFPVMVLVTQRPPDPGRTPGHALRELPCFTELVLAAFGSEEAEQLIKLKLAQLFGFEGAPPRLLVDRLALRSAGNPFYLEELLNFIKDQGIDFQDAPALERWELPDTLQALILSRIDRLTQTEQSSLKVASVIGRLFRAAVVWGVQAQAEPQAVSADLVRLCDALLIALDQPEPELVYIFRHVVTQEVAYESLPHATRARLHNEIGLCLERLYADRLERQLDLLAFHFDRSQNLAKKREYLQRAGHAAQAHYANTAAISYYERVLPLLPPEEQITTQLKLGKVWELVGQWSKAGACYQQGFELAGKLNDPQAQARCQAATGDLRRKEGLYAEANRWLDLARRGFEEIGDQPGLGQTLHAAGTVAAMQGDYPKARSLYEQSLAIRQNLAEKAQIGSLLSNLGILARYHAEAAAARRLMEQSLEIRREVGDRWAIANSLNNLGVILREMMEYASARPLLEESLALNRQVGDRWAVANTLTSLAELAADEQAWESARGFLQESLSINLELGDRTAAAYILECFARIAAAQGRANRALQLAGAASALRAVLGSPLSPAEQVRLDRYLAPARQGLELAQQAAAFGHGQALGFEQAVATALRD